MSEVTTCIFPNCKTNAIRNSSYCVGHTKLFGQKPVKPESKIPKVSENQKSELKQYEKKRKEFLKRNAFCRANLPGCIKIATQCHHSVGRTGENLLDEKTWVPVCGPCHIAIEQNPLLAKEIGVSKSRLTA